MEIDTSVQNHFIYYFILFLFIKKLILNNIGQKSTKKPIKIKIKTLKRPKLSGLIWLINKPIVINIVKTIDITKKEIIVNFKKIDISSFFLNFS